MGVVWRKLILKYMIEDFKKQSDILCTWIGEMEGSVLWRMSVSSN